MSMADIIYKASVRTLMVRLLFSCGDEWKVGGEFMAESKFLHRVMVKKK